MFIVCFLLFVAGLYCMGISFSVIGWQAVIFILGLLLVSAALAIPIHTSRAKGVSRR